MKQSKPLTLILFSVIALVMSGCGKSGNSAPTPPLVNGQVNGYPGYPNGGGTGSFGSACMPLTSPINFSGMMYIDSSNVMAGMGAPAPTSGNGTNYGAIQMASQANGPYGQIMIQAQMISVNGATGGGQLILSQAAIADAARQSGMPYGQVPCASIVGINLGHYNTVLYGGSVQIMINGNIPYSLYF